MPLTKDQILGALDLEHEDIEVHEWGGTVRIRSMTAAERDSFEGQIFKESRDGGRVLNMDNLRARLLALTIVDGNNKRIFQDGDTACNGPATNPNACAESAVQRVMAACVSRGSRDGVT